MIRPFTVIIHGHIQEDDFNLAVRKLTALADQNEAPENVFISGEPIIQFLRPDGIETVANQWCSFCGKDGMNHRSGAHFALDACPECHAAPGQECFEHCPNRLDND